MITLLTDRWRVAFVIDDGDEYAVKRYTWRINSRGYPETSIGKWPEVKNFPLHQFILGPAPPGLEWDHINRNKLDNRRENIRAVTHKVNSLRVSNKSGAPGVNFIRGRGKWRATICVDGRTVHLGYFHDRAAAVVARAAGERSHWELP